MRHLKISTTFIGLSFLSALCMAEQNQPAAPKPQKVPIILVKINKGVSSKRPKAPDRQVVTCAYDGEDMHLSFVIPEGMATLSVTDESLLSSTYAFDTSLQEITVIVGALEGAISIEIGTEWGNVYKGEID